MKKAEAIKTISKWGTLFLLLFFCETACRSGSAQVQATTPVSESDFVPVYKLYADTINREGGKGMRKLATPDFVTYSPVTHNRLQGESAFDEIAKWFRQPAYQNVRNRTKQYIVKFSVSMLTEKNALIYTEEIYCLPDYWMNIYAVPVGPSEYMQGKPRLIITDLGKYMITWKSSSRWKQTWRKTTDGWKMTSLDQDTRTETARDAQDFFNYVVKSEVFDPMQEKRISPTP